MGTTKKVKSTGRFGSRYGVGIKKRILKVEEKQKKYSNCPFCGFKKVRRKSQGIFKCKKCESEFTGGAYLPETLVGRSIKKMVGQKSFMKDMADLMKATEKKETSYSEIEEEVSKSTTKKEKEAKVV